ncbi:hypothetical protein Tco_0997384, partial [Tanacetum coccineum]
DTYPILLSFTHCGNKSILRVLRIILVILPEHPSETIVFHNEDGNPARANIKQALGYLKDGDGDGNSQPHKGVKASANSDVMYFFTSAQDGDPSQDDVRLCLGDDLKKAQDHSQRQADKIAVVFISVHQKFSDMGKTYKTQVVRNTNIAKLEAGYIFLENYTPFCQVVAHKLYGYTAPRVTLAAQSLSEHRAAKTPRPNSFLPIARIDSDTPFAVSLQLACLASVLSSVTIKPDEI